MNQFLEIGQSKPFIIQDINSPLCYISNIKSMFKKTGRINFQPPLNLTQTFNYSPLSEVAYSGKTAIVQFLLSQPGVDVNCKNI